MRRLLLRAMAVAGVMLLAGCGDGAAGLDRLSAGERCKVVAATSGEVIVLDSGLTVRLAGIQTPFPDEPGGQAARDALSRLVLGKRVELLYGGLRRDPRGRALAQVRLTDSRVWVEGALLRDGLALARTYADNRAMSREMDEDEAQARIARRGLWGQGLFRVLLPQEVGRGAEGYQIVEGRVRDLTPLPRGTYLEFSDDHRGFAALIAPSALADLADAGKSAPSLVGRLVRLRGPVDWKGLMAVDHPEQIEVLKAK
jgi:endonuclease YncB( thermonuclease family)